MPGLTTLAEVADLRWLGAALDGLKCFAAEGYLISSDLSADLGLPLDGLGGRALSEAVRLLRSYAFRGLSGEWSKC